MSALVDGLYEKPVTLPIAPHIRWEDDCQGKKDYDGPVISVSTRYWPGPEQTGPNTFDTQTGQWSANPYGRMPSAHASIVIDFTDEHDNHNFIVLRERHFEAPTEQLCKAAVEGWVKMNANHIARILLADYEKGEPHA